MAKARYAQTNFLGGEWSKTAQGRFDLPTYRTALNVCLNGYPIETGAWTRRGGTRFLGATKKGFQATLKKFDFSQDIPYTLEFTQGFLRFWAGTSLATTNDDMTVTAISAANPAVVTIAAAPTVALVSGQTVFFNGLGTNNPLLQNRRFTITVLTAVTFSLQDEITAANIDGSTLGAFVSGTMSRVQEIATTYAGATQLNLRSVQAELQSVLLNGTAPMVLTAVQFGGATFSTFTLAPAVFRDGPYLDPVKGNITVTPGALSGTVTLTLAPRAYSATQGYTIGDYVTSGGNTYRSIADLNINNAPPNASWWKSVPPDDFIGTQGFTTSDIGRMIRLFSEPALWLVGTAYVTGNHVKYNNVYWVALQNSTGKTPGADTTNWGLAPESAVWTWGKISSLSSLIANVSNIGNYSSLANAFDGNIGTSAFASGSTGFGGGSLELVHQFDMYAGQNYGGTPKKIASAIAYPDKSLGWMNTSNGLNSNAYVIVNLRAKNSAPGSPSDGTLLGTSGNIANSSNAVTINSSDASTSWQYVWLEVFYNVETHVNSLGRVGEHQRHHYGRSAALHGANPDLAPRRLQQCDLADLRHIPRRPVMAGWSH